MSAFESLRIAGSGLGMHQTWLDALSHNIANVGTVRATDQEAFRAQLVVAESREDGGVRGEQHRALHLRARDGQAVANRHGRMRAFQHQRHGAEGAGRKARAHLA